ncbi:hypothetical protein JCM10207_005698 [Rhodosporidiobolus poonsookiae]
MSLVAHTLDDYLVASFPLPQQHHQPSTFPPPVTAVSYTAHPRQDARLAVATPGVGVSVYDLNDQTPLSSITVGPSFSPSTAAVSRSTPSSTSDSIRVKSHRRTWVGVRTDEGKGEIWCWHEEERKDGSTEGDAGKAVWPISEPLAALAAPRTLPAHIAFLSSSGALALAPADDLTSLASLSAPERIDASSTLAWQTLRLIPVSAASYPAFLPSSLAALLPASASQAHLAVIVRTYASPAPKSPAGTSASLVEIGKKKFKKNPRPSSSAVIDAAELSAAATAQASGPKRSEIELVLLDPQVSVPDEMEARLGLVSLGKVDVEGEQVVVSDDGFVTALSSEGVLSSFRLSFAEPPAVETYSTLFFPSAPVETASLTLSPVKTLTLSSTALTPSRTVLLALHSSFVLLASPRPSAEGSTPTVTATLWDARFGSAIASTDLAVPSAVASSVAALGLSVSLPAKHTAILTFSPAAASPSASRTALFAIPLTSLPSASVLAAVVGKHALTARFLAPASSSSSSSGAVASPAQAVLDLAKRAEPLRSLRLAQNPRKAALLAASQSAREALLASLALTLEPLRAQASASAQDKAVKQAESEWEKYLDGERDRLLEYNRAKVREAMEAEQERKLAALRGEAVEGAEPAAAAEGSRYAAAKRKIERVLKAAGAGVVPGSDEKGVKSWKEVTGVRIKGVSDAHRYRYHKERNKAEEAMGKTVKEFDVEEAVSKVERYEPSLPSSFITALFRLSFPIALDAPSTSTDLALASTTPASPTAVFRHPTKLVRYLLSRELVGENQLLGGVTRFLARAGDWDNTLVALRTVIDIPESTTVALLVAVLRASTAAVADSSAMEVDAPPSLPATPPALETFLPAFLAQPYTPAVLRTELQTQLSPAEAVPVLELCDAWLAAWLKASRSDAAGEEGEKGEKDEEKKRTRKSRAVRADLFKVQAGGAPPMEQIVPFVQALLDAHFVTLLLQRQSHRLLRRLSSHIAAHTAAITDLSSLLGALGIFARAKDAARKAAQEEEQRRKDRAEGRAEQVKAFGETLERRIKAQEKHAEVGAYSVDEYIL